MNKYKAHELHKARHRRKIRHCIVRAVLLVAFFVMVAYALHIELALKGVELLAAVVTFFEWVFKLEA